MNERSNIETESGGSKSLSTEVAELMNQDLTYKTPGELYEQKSKVEALLTTTEENSADREPLLKLLEEINGLLEVEDTDRKRVRKVEDIGRLREINKELAILGKTIRELLEKKASSKIAKEKRDIDIELGGIDLRKIRLLRERASLKEKGHPRYSRKEKRGKEAEKINTVGENSKIQAEIDPSPEENTLEKILEIIKREEENIRRYEAELAEIIAYKYGGGTRASEKHPERNEDSWVSLPKKKVFAVFDGVGGRAAGNFASDFIARDLEVTASSIASAPTSSEKEKVLKEIFKQINSDLLKETRKLGLDGSSTTASFVHIFKEEGQTKALIANIGDSRVYLLMDDGTLVQATEDDSRINLILQSGTYTPEQAEASKQKLNNVEKAEDLTEEEMRLFDVRNEITSALGASTQEAPAVRTISLEGVRKILLTTDGIHDPLTDKRIAEILAQEKPSSEIANDLILLAEAENERKTFRHKKDDKTAIVINV